MLLLKALEDMACSETLSQACVEDLYGMLMKGTAETTSNRIGSGLI